MSYRLKRFTRLAIKVPVVLGAAWWVSKKFRKGVKPVPVTHVDIQNCIDHCTQTAQTIRNIANEVVDHRARYALSEADRHIELCIHTCLDAKGMTQSQSQSQS